MLFSVRIAELTGDPSRLGRVNKSNNLYTNVRQVAIVVVLLLVCQR
jgi:hypothetical protein